MPARAAAREDAIMPANRLPYSLPKRSDAWMLQRADELLAEMRGRHSCRHFSDRPVPRELIERLVAVANTAPSGANRQPWRFVAVDDPGIKREIRIAAEAEERENYDRRMPPEWLEALEPLGTDADKPFLEIAPWLIVLFRVDWEEVPLSAGARILSRTSRREDRSCENPFSHPPPRDSHPASRRLKSYYPAESVGIAAGMFLMACHQVGLATLTHTPSPMGFLRRILARGANEKPFLLIPVGYPAKDCTVPELAKKPVEQVLQWNR